MRDPIRRSSRALFIVTPVLACACGLQVHRAERGPKPDAPLDPGLTRPTSQPSAPTLPSAPEATLDPAILPSSMSCVSSPLDDRTTVPQVLRVRIVDGTDTASVTLWKGPQFSSHGGTTSGTAIAQDVRAVDRSTDGRVLDQPGWLHIQLRREGPVMRGSLLDDGTPELALICWNESELSGSPWAHVPSLLPAHFDPSVGACVDAAGSSALNPTPIEVVRETRSGECSDLRGVALNGDDFAAPDLDGWRLAGARLDGARLMFANLRFASLQGADLSELDFGYATIQGPIDGNTALPSEDQGCQVTRSPWAGDSVSCTR